MEVLEQQRAIYSSSLCFYLSVSLLYSIMVIENEKYVAVVIHTERMRNWSPIASRIHGLLRCSVAIIGIVQVQVTCCQLASVL